ncbi:MAG: hypothetical protein KGL39_20290 [Patescibacteria group bacterium]|nr:hypothetical protein [Patescibacteria group bacterium]
MANANTARGLVPYKYVSGAPYNGAANIYNVPATYATALYLGQPLVATGASDANGIPVLQTASAGGGAYTIGPMVGIVDGGDPVVAVTRDLPIYHPASTNQYILVADDPNLLFWIQEDSVGGSIAMATAGMKNADLIAGNGSTVTGWSGWMLDSSSINTTNSLQLRLISGLQEADNTMASSYAKWLVKINLHSLTNTTGV